MYNDLYLETLNTEIFIESIELTFSNINSNDKISILLEDGNTSNKNIIMKAVDAVMKKIKEIIDWIKSKLFGSDNKKYEDFLKLADNKVSGLYVEFDKSPKKVYELYSDIFEVLSKNYNKLPGNDNSNFIDEIKDKLDKDIKKERVSPKECLDLMYKYDKLSLYYKGLSNEISTSIEFKAKRGVNCSQEQKTLSLIARILSDMRNNMTKISPRKISTNSGIISKVKRWANENPTKATSLIISLTAIGAITGMSAGINSLKNIDARIKTDMKNHDAHMRAEKDRLDKEHKDNMKVLDERHRKIDEIIRNVDLSDRHVVNKAIGEMKETRKQYRH